MSAGLAAALDEVARDLESLVADAGTAHEQLVRASRGHAEVLAASGPLVGTPGFDGVDPSTATQRRVDEATRALRSAVHRARARAEAADKLLASVHDRPRAPDAVERLVRAITAARGLL